MFVQENKGNEKTTRRPEKNGKRLQREAGEGLRAVRLFGAAADVFKRGFEENFFDGVLNILPKLAEAAVFAFGAFRAEAFAGMGAARFGEGAVDDPEDFADGNLVGVARQGVAAVDAASAFENAAVLEFEQNLLEILEGNVMALGNILDGDDLGILTSEMKNSLSGVFAFCGHAHRCY